MNNSILLILVFNYLRKALETKKNDPKLDNLLLAGLLVSTALFLAAIPAQLHLRNIVPWLSHVLMLAMIVIVLVKKEMRPARMFLYATLPLAIIDFTSDLLEVIAPETYASWNNYFDVAGIFSVIWLIAMMIVNSRQRKAMLKEREKLQEKEREAKRAEEMKHMLESQVKERTAELVEQKQELQKALDDLKAAQIQLVQSEKMASLGELTAGIAHEIQNPLNFVNNFSELNSELIKELRNEVMKGDQAEIDALLNDIESNSEKITHHGKRADAIVKGMLQHSRTSSGQKELTDINTLCDEYLRLSYHGLRAKDKTFNAKFETDFDNSIGKINVVPQDIGRVILNLINNAFYAVNEKGKSGFTNLTSPYEPTVSVSTKRINDKIEVRVTDNGNGIPAAIKEKIFQPFFTTKPTGEGTGLGLSLSYDIITKGHNGELNVETAEGEGTTFAISLPCS